jgi:voltage-dependent potassium channel beta subunit
MLLVETALAPSHFATYCVSRIQATQPLSYCAMAPATITTTKMTYRFLGDSGLLVSKLALGSWMFPDQTHTVDAWYKMMLTAYQGGVNFFDSAENYALGQADVLMGGAIKKGIEEGVWSREDLVVTAKIFSGTKGFRNGTPNSQGLNRKHLIEGTQAALGRMGLEYVDVIFCHHPEPCTPIEETVRAMNFVINQGWAFYWGTSNWPASATFEAGEIADRLGLIRPIAEQSQYNIFARGRVEYELTPLFKRYNFSVTSWSPLSFGTLSGKYSAAVPEGSRFSIEAMQKGPYGGEVFTSQVQKADKLKAIADKLGCSLPQMSIAWCIANEHVATVMIGASKASQLEENLKALAFVDKITPEVKAEIDGIVQYEFTPWVDPHQDSRMRHL